MRLEPPFPRALAATVAIVVAGCAGEPSIGPSPSPTPGPGGRFAYAISAASNRVGQFRIDGASGALTSLGDIVLEGADAGLAAVATPSGRILYVARQGGNGGIDGFAIDRGTGLLQRISGSPFDPGHQTDFFTAHPDGIHLWAGRAFNSQIDVLNLDPTGALTVTASMTVPAPVAAALRPDGRFLYLGRGDRPEIRVASVESSTGRLSSTAILTTGDAVRSLTAGPSGDFLYATLATALTVDTLRGFTLDRQSGVPTPVSGSMFASGFDAFTANLRPDRVTFDPTGRFAYVLDRAARTGARSRGVFVFPVGGDGRLGPQFLGPYSTPGDGSFLIGDNAAFTLDPSGRFAFLADASSGGILAFSVDASTGALLAVGPMAPGPRGASAIIVTP